MCRWDFSVRKHSDQRAKELSEFNALTSGSFLLPPWPTHLTKIVQWSHAAHL